MRSISFKIIIPVLLIICSYSSQAQHLLSVNGKDIVNENQEPILLRGMGLGGWMLQEGYMLQTAGFANPQHQIRAAIQELIGEEDTDLFYETWLANHVQKADIDSLKSWGFNSVRLPMHYNLFTLPIEAEPVAGEHTWLTKGFELTDSLISWCVQNEMYVILDLHAAPGGQGYDEGISDYDTSKPSLWESEANRDKTVALWKNLAERYADEQWVAGYDLLNEPNWNLPGGTALRNLYQEITDSIRTVDAEHIIFIEGNWFANDFTGLTPPWDDNLVYSPHKYWSFNEPEVMNWVTEMRDEYNVPLYLGESGENSNVWFRDAIRLMEDLNIGWAWWPMKKIESVPGPLSVIKTPEYQSLLDYWNGEGDTPTAEFAKETLMEIAEGLKIENCVYQHDVIDAMFRQVYSDDTRPYHTAHTIPGVIHATDFDLGVVGAAYYDLDVANYQVSTGNFTAWNNGWSYRNDGVDIEKCEDDVNTNGYNVGWMDAGEWMQYEVDVIEDAIYEIHARVSSGGEGGQMYFSVGDAAITPTIPTGGTGDWQAWQTVIIPDVLLTSADEKIRLNIEQSGFNLNSFEFINTGVSSTSVPAQFVSAETTDLSNITMNCSKPLVGAIPAAPSNFFVFVNGTSIPVTSVTLDADNPRILNFAVDFTFSATDLIKISYNGDQINATDGTLLDNFLQEDVQNNINSVLPIPGRIQAESYAFQLGVQLEETTDEGGGQNIGYLDPGDYLDYEVEIASAGTYTIDYRTASEWATGGLILELIDETGSITNIQSPTFELTGGWQDWTTTTTIASLPEGFYTMRLTITEAPFNLNWIDFNISTSTESTINSSLLNARIFPNPTQDLLQIEANLMDSQDLLLELQDISGKVLFAKEIKEIDTLKELISLSNIADGCYFLSIKLANGTQYSERIIKMSK